MSTPPASCISSPGAAPRTSAAAKGVASPQQTVPRTTSGALMQGGREVEIEHAGRVYRLRLTQLNKLILTA
ncbi:MAG: hemin uptake protein HemP [Pseudomonadota bacterium]